MSEVMTTDIETVREVLNTAPLVGRGYSQGGMEDSCREAHSALSRIERVVEAARAHSCERDPLLRCPRCVSFAIALGALDGG